MAARLFGLDIGRSFVKVVEVSINGNVRTLKAAGSILSPAGGMQSESPLDL